MVVYQLSEEQQSVIDADDPAMVVVASAGSGKTEVVARRVERLLSESSEGVFQVLALSYTHKAAEEMEDRFTARLGSLGSRVDCDTVHGFAHSLLRKHGTRIGLPIEPEILTRHEDKAELLSEWLRELGQSVPADLDAVFRQLDLAQAKEEDAFLLQEWRSALQNAGAIDYASMLTRAGELLELRAARLQISRLYSHLIVDEAQNLTPAQYSFLTSLLSASDGLGDAISAMVVGDEKQSIVGFAGADPGLIARFASEFEATRYELSVNFRSARLLAELGHSVAGDLDRDPESEVVSYAALGNVEIEEYDDEEDEAAGVVRWIGDLLKSGLPHEAMAEGESLVVQPEEIAVLARSAASLRAVEAELERIGEAVAIASTPDAWLSTVAAKVALELIALRSSATHRSTRWQLERLLSLDTSFEEIELLPHLLAASSDRSLRPLASLVEADDPQDFVRILGSLEFSDEVEAEEREEWEADKLLIGRAWTAFVNRTAIAEQTWGNFRIFVSRQQRGDEGDPGVRLLTVHKAQGREYKAVAIVGLNDGQMPDFRATAPEQFESELRTFYVGVTRPSRVLLLTRARTRTTRYGRRVTEPSPFLAHVSTT